MHAAALDTITDIDTLRRLALQGMQASAELVERDRLIVYKDAKIETLTAEIARLKRWQFAAKAERFDPAQKALFEQAMAADIAAVEAELEQYAQDIGHKPAKPPVERAKRQALPAHLLRIDERCDLDNCTCGRCGAELVTIGEDISEKLDCEPTRFFVRRQIRAKYACRSCETVSAAPVPASIIDRGIAAPGLLAQVLVAKYADHLPLYRQSEIYRRSGVELARSTLAEWIGVTGVALQPLVDALRAELIGEPVLHADETPVALLDPGAGKTKRAYLFAYRRAEPGAAPIIVFDFCANRSGANARRFLEHYGGALVVDDYGGYKKMFAEQPIIELACWAHARRQFFDLHAAGKSLIAQQALERIAGLYAVEADARAFDAAARHDYREQHARPKLDALLDWLTTLRPQVSNGSGTARAIDYLLKRRIAFARYLDDGRYPIDNNPVENAIRPIALGRKNWLFAGSETAGRRAAAIMSLIASAKANGHDPFAYLKDVLTRLPTHPNRRIGELLPHTWQPQA
jgi:transposase